MTQEETTLLKSKSKSAPTPKNKGVALEYEHEHSRWALEDGKSTINTASREMILISAQRRRSQYPT
jgi:hypothetical protein